MGQIAHATPRLQIEATVSEDLRTVTGTVSGELDPDWTWVDPLADLPVPTGDRDLVRTFPGRPSVGTIDFDPETGAFTARLPRRFGASGTTPQGLYANGGWLPVLLDEDGLVFAEWEVRIGVPEGAVGVVGDAVGQGVVTWDGVGERVVLAVVPNGRVEVLEADELTVEVVSRRRLPKRFATRLQANLEQLDGLAAGHAAVVVAPLRERLARPGPGALFLSDDAWRLTPGMRRFHDEPIRKGLAEALLDLSPFERALVAEVVASESRKDMDEALAVVSWIPLVDQTLNDRSMPFATEVLDDPIPSHPLFDDLVERFDPHWAPGAAAVQLDLAHGPGTTEAVVRTLLDGGTLSPELEAHLAALDAPPPEQDLVLDVHADTVTVRHEGPDSGAGQVVPLRIGERELVWVLEGDAEEASFSREPGESVALDPEAAVPQTSRFGDRAPAKVKPTVTGSAGNISLSPLALDGFVTANLRRADNSRTVWSPGVYFGDQVLAEGRLSVVQMFGRPLDALRREHQLFIGPSLLWLDPRYAGESAIGQTALGARVGYTWDTKGESLFPLQGHTLSATVDAGSLLTSPQRWTRGDLRVAGVAAVHPRLATALQLTGAYSDSPFEHKAIDLGTLDGLLSVPIGTVIGRARGTGRLELRAVPIRYADLPLLVLWGTELQLSAGVEAGMLETADGLVSAVGASGGVSFILDLGGAKPTMTGITAGWLLWTDGFEVEPTPLPQLVIRSDQWF